MQSLKEDVQQLKYGDKGRGVRGGWWRLSGECEEGRDILGMNPGCKVAWMKQKRAIPQTFHTFVSSILQQVETDGTKQ